MTIRRRSPRTGRLRPRLMGVTWRRLLGAARVLVSLSEDIDAIASSIYRHPIPGRGRLPGSFGGGR